MYLVARNRRPSRESDADAGSARATTPPAPEGDPLEAEVIELYGEHAASMLRYAALMTESAETAQDAVQEAFLRYVALRGSGEEVRSPRAWLLRVMRNYLLDVAKQSRSRVHVCIEEAHGRAAQSAAGNREALLAQVTDMLPSLLSARELESLRLRAEGFSYAEIAEVLDISAGTVGAMLTRAHSKIRRALASGNESTREALRGRPKEVPDAP